MSGVNPLSAAAASGDPEYLRSVSRDYYRNAVGSPDVLVSRWRNAEKPGRLRVGYLSSDFREHAVGRLMSDVFALHDRTRVEVWAYNSGPSTNEPTQRRISSTVEHWCDLSYRSDVDDISQILSDGIQILIDLNGYTAGERQRLLSMRPAPVIMNWLGFPGTMATPHHDYIVADESIIPPELEGHYSERVLRLPCYQPSAAIRSVWSHPQLKESVGLPLDRFVFACFSQSWKLTKATLDRWWRILQETRDSVLWLLESDPETNERVRRNAEEAGVEPGRVVFAPKVPNPIHLARHKFVDLFLDTHPYGSHTTGSDALWCGVPVLTYPGKSFAARVCASLVSAAGIPEFVCSGPEQYVERAVACARDPGVLSGVRRKMADERECCALFDTRRLVSELESLLFSAWTERAQP